jgi:hypothetical protein
MRLLVAPCALPERSPSPHEADNHTGAGKRWRLAFAAFLLFGPCHRERTGVDLPPGSGHSG